MRLVSPSSWTGRARLRLPAPPDSSGVWIPLGRHARRAWRRLACVRPGHWLTLVAAAQLSHESPRPMWRGFLYSVDCQASASARPFVGDAPGGALLWSTTRGRSSLGATGPYGTASCSPASARPGSRWGGRFHALPAVLRECRAPSRPCSWRGRPPWRITAPILRGKGSSSSRRSAARYARSLAASRWRLASLAVSRASSAALPLRGR